MNKISEKFWLLLPLALIPAAFYFLGADWTYFLVWWLALFLGGIAIWPLAATIFPFTGSSYPAAKASGLLIPAFLLWQLSHLKILPFSRWTAILVLLACAAVCWLMPSGRRTIAQNAITDKNFWSKLAVSEFLFGAALFFWTYARGLKPELDNLEKFMNIGFMNSVWRTDYLPAGDMWFAGGKINYYYFGQYLYTYLAKLTAIRPETAYNLAMATTLALTFTLSFALISQLLQTASIKDRRLSGSASFTGGLLAAFLVTFAGNSHAFFFAESSPGFKVLNFLRSAGLVKADSPRAFWFADPTRFIGYNPETADKTIHEFPFYSFLVADLHAHVINLAMVLLLLLCLAGLAKSPGLIRKIYLSGQGSDLVSGESSQDADDSTWYHRQLINTFHNFSVTARNRNLLFSAVLLSVFMMGNYWDFAIYLVVTGMVLLFINSKVQGSFGNRTSPLFFLIQVLFIAAPYLLLDNPLWTFAALVFACVFNFHLTIASGSALTLTGAQISWLFALSHFFALPFNLGFDPIAKDIAAAANHTPVWQFIILWGPHLLAGGLFIFVWSLWGQKAKWKNRSFPPPAEAVEQAQIPITRQARFFSKFFLPDIFVFILFASAFGLLILPELVYVVDIYSGDFKRANTMFKFTYQAFVLLSLVWAYGLSRLIFTRGTGSLNNKKNVYCRWPLIATGIFLSLLLVIPAWYPPIAARQWLGDFSRKNYRGLDGLSPLIYKDSPQLSDDLGRSLAADVAAIKWLNSNVRGQPVILESFGESYTDFCRISAFTGLPTIVGWETHQWLWRTSKTHPNAYGSVVLPRQEAVRLIYTTASQEERINLLESYNVSYIIVGNLERERFSSDADNGSRVELVREDLLRQLGTIVFSQDGLYIISLIDS